MEFWQLPLGGTWFCATCALAMDSLVPQGAPRSWRLVPALCPHCQGKVELNGALIIVFACLWALLWPMILCYEAQFVGLYGGALILAFGLFRQVRQGIQIWRRHHHHA